MTNPMPYRGSLAQLHDKVIARHKGILDTALAEINHVILEGSEAFSLLIASVKQEYQGLEAEVIGELHPRSITMEGASIKKQSDEEREAITKALHKHVQYLRMLHIDLMRLPETYSLWFDMPFFNVLFRLLHTTGYQQYIRYQRTLKDIRQCQQRIAQLNNEKQWLEQYVVTELGQRSKLLEYSNNVRTWIESLSKQTATQLIYEYRLKGGDCSPTGQTSATSPQPKSI